MYSEDAASDRHGQILPVSPAIHRRPWPSRKVSETEEMVKYMSSIPRYLQHEENEFTVQEKALNVGVLDWGQLQKWTDHEKPVPNKISHAIPSKSSSTSDLRSSAENHQRKGRRKDSNIHLIKSQPVEIGRNANTEVVKLSELERFEISTGQESCRSHLYQDGDRPKQSRRKHLEEIIARSISGFDASLLDQPMKMKSESFARTSPLPPRSSSPSSNTLRDEPHETKKIASFERGREIPPIFLPRADLKGISGSPMKSNADNSNEAVSRSSSRGRRSPMRQFLDQPRKSTSSISSVSDNPDVVGGRSSSRGRRSPVKQMLDPSLNSSTSDVSSSRSSSRGKRSPLRQMFELPRKSSSSVNSSQQLQQESGGTVDPSTCNENLSSDPKHFPSTRQALLKLSWKNGLPLLMFSSSDDSIFVAMMHKRGNSGMNVCDCFYEIHTAMAIEVKKKNGAWLSQGIKSKKPEFACKFVAELIVSSSERVSFDLTHRSFIRELVLLGDELVPSNRVDAANLSSSELAAIVVESSQQKSPSSCGILCVPQIVAILPSDVHGLSNTRGPSKLIERWKSGGSCDCGGWDEGCALMILTNNSQEIKNSKSVEDCGTIDGISCGFDLFTEGDARKGKHSFSMVAFKEDMFTVEFKASIHLLQAFAISIAMLHDRNSGDDVIGNHAVDMDAYEDLSFDSCPLVSS